MKLFLLPLFTFFSLLIPLRLQAAAVTNQYITMNLPETVIVKAMQRVLPLSLNPPSSMLDGTITIINISNFRVKDQQILCRLDLMGKNLHLVTRVGNQNIRLKLGSAKVNFDCDIRIRYDRTKQILYIQTAAINNQGAEEPRKGDITQALLLILNGQEFPIAMQNLKPIIAEASDKIITIRTNIEEIRAIKGALQLSLTPNITASPRPGVTTPRATVKQ